MWPMDWQQQTTGARGTHICRNLLTIKEMRTQNLASEGNDED